MLDTTLARALAGGRSELPPASIERAAYHGIGPLLFARTGAEVFRAEARARAMWELRHRHVLGALLAALAAAGVRVLVMKGTAIAYDLYPDAAQRPRGDSDILIAPSQVETARAVLRAQGFAPFFDRDIAPEAGRSQEPWQFAAPDGSAHDIDLHWQALNGPSLSDLIPVDEAMAEATALPALSPDAMALSRVHGFLHACVHRAQHIVSPYFVGDVAHYGGDRLIWLVDIDLLARALTPAEWDEVIARASARGVAPVCLAALRDAERLLGTPLLDDIVARLQAAPGGPAADYLLRQGRVGRALADAGTARGPYFLYRLFPPAALIRAKYPRSRLPLPLLYLRRIAGFVLGRQA